MKGINGITTGLIILLLVFITCKPEPVDPPPLPQSPSAPVNQPPVANAGTDTSIRLPSCGATGSIMLDGKASSDPENSALSYSWKVIFAPNNRYRISNFRTAQLVISNMTAGEFDLELTVTDPFGLTARDTVVVVVSFVASVGNQYDFDITINGSFHFQDNYSDCYYCYPCCYMDLSSIYDAAGNFPPIGDFYFYAYENADSATTSNSHNTHFGLYTYNNDISVNGTTSINLKKVFQSGGGAFNGTFTPMGGSALNCDASALINLAPLTDTGTLDTTAHSITLNIKG